MNYINIIAESLDDLDYDGPEEGQEFENTYVYFAGCPVYGATIGVEPEEYCDEGVYTPVYVNIINNNTIRLQTQWIDEEKLSGYELSGNIYTADYNAVVDCGGVLAYNPVTKKCKWISEDISKYSSQLADLILNGFNQMMIETYERSLQMNLAEMVVHYLEILEE